MTHFYDSDNTKPPIKGIVLMNQLHQWPSLKRISPFCEGCGQDYAYHIHKKKVSTRTSNFLEVLLSRQILYYISCPNCTFSMELDYDEYSILKKLSIESSTSH